MTSQLDSGLLVGIAIYVWGSEFKGETQTNRDKSAKGLKGVQRMKNKCCDPKPKP